LFSPFLFCFPLDDISISDYGNNTMVKINKNRIKILCNIPVLTKSGAGSTAARQTKSTPEGVPAQERRKPNIEN